MEAKPLDNFVCIRMPDCNSPFPSERIAYLFDSEVPTQASYI